MLANQFEGKEGRMKREKPPTEAAGPEPRYIIVGLDGDCLVAYGTVDGKTFKCKDTAAQIAQAMKGYGQINGAAVLPLRRS